MGRETWGVGMSETKAIRSYRDLEIWQEGIDLVQRVYQMTTRFPKEEVYGLTSQMRRAAASIPVNIAEGHSRQHRAEYRQFLHITLGSIAELETLGVIAQRVGLVSPSTLVEILEAPLASIRNKTLALLRRLPTGATPPVSGERLFAGSHAPKARSPFHGG